MVRDDQSNSLQFYRLNINLKETINYKIFAHRFKKVQIQYLES